jgi:peptide chain release factor subunit 1
VQVNDLDQERLRRLAEHRPQNGHKVLSVYMDLDPATFGTQPARAAQVTSLVDAADRRIRAAELDHDARTVLKQDLDRVRDALRAGEAAKGAHGLAIFASQPRELFEVLRLPDAVPQTVVLNDAPWLDPLVGRGRTRRAVALVNRRTFRLIADGPDGSMHEVVALADQVPSQHDKGGWSQSNYERSIEEEVRKHLEHSAALLFEQHQEEPCDQLAVGVSAELWPELERMVHAYVRERTLGRFDVDVEHVNLEQAVAAARPLFDAAARSELEGRLGRLQQALAQGERAAGGLAAVLEALSERRVETLLYETGFSSPGYVCPQSGWLGVGPAACPSGEGNAQARENVLDDAIAAAIVQRAEVCALVDRPELGPHGGIAALLRF